MRSQNFLRTIEVEGFSSITAEGAKFMAFVRLYVGNFDKDITKEELRELFEDYGEVRDVKIQTDPKTGKSLGFGSVEIKGNRDAKQAVRGLDWKRWWGRTLRVMLPSKEKL